jgi:hypothetical protein
MNIQQARDLVGSEVEFTVGSELWIARGRVYEARMRSLYEPVELLVEQFSEWGGELRLMKRGWINSSRVVDHGGKRDGR